MGFFLTLFLFIGTLLLSEILKPKPQNESIRPAGLGDFNFPTATEERVIPLIWGTVKLEGPNVVWYGDLRQKAIKEKVKTGLFSSDDITVGYRYFIGIQFGFCRGPVDSIHRIWVGDEEAWSGTVTDGAIDIDLPKFFGGNNLGQGGLVGTFRFFPGSQGQSPSTYLSAFQQQGGDTPAYVGTAYGVWEGGWIGNTTSVKPWSFELRRLPVGPSGTTLSVNSGVDANPAFVIYEILTNTEWGLGFSNGDIDTTQFETVATTLQSEGNGFSFILDRPMQLSELIEELQRQIDGVVFLDQSTGKWTIKLARDDYDVALIDELDETNLIEIKEFTRGAWEDTVNTVLVPFKDRNRDYQGTAGMAQDMANIRIQGVVVKSSVSFPGVKDATLANNLAWRELRLLSFPLCRAVVVVNREFWDTVPTDVLKWTSEALGFSNLVMRVSRVDLGRLDQGQIELTLVQDVFGAGAAVFSDPPATGWTPPSSNLVAIPSNETVAIEAPKAFLERDPDALTRGLPFRVWAAARNQGDGAVEYDLRTRTGGSPFQTGRTVQQFLLLGELKSSLATGTTGGGATTATVTITPTPDTQSEILEEFSDVDDVINGENLTQLILIDDEFMLVSNAVANGSDIDLQDVYRGVLDSAQAAHAAGAKVWLLFVGGGIDSIQYANGETVDVRLVTRSRDDELSEASATNVQVIMNNRHLRPYPPIALSFNGTVYPTTAVSLDANGSLDAAGIQTGFRRRDYEEFQENARHIGGDAAPSNTTTVYRARVFDSSGGSDVELFVTDYNAGGNTVFVDRTKVLRFTSGLIPSELRVDVETKHTLDSVDYEALQDASYTFPTESAALGDDFNLGVLTDLTVSSTWTAPSSGDYDFSIGTANSGGDIEARLNGGAWTPVITSGNTTGTLVGVTAGDSIEVRSNGLNLGGVRAETILLVDAPSVTTDAYAVFVE